MKPASIALYVVLSAAALIGQPAPEPLAIVGATVIDGLGGTPYRATVIVREGRISAVDRAGGSPDGARLIEATGLTLLPGLIDAHVHISDPRAARRALVSGVTTARSMGTSHFADVGLRELIGRGAVEGPELLAAGYHVRPQPAEALFLQHPQLARFLDGVSGPTAFRSVAAANLDRGVDFIKIVVTDRAGLPTTDPRRQIMSRAEAEAVVKAAAEREVPVAAHAHGDSGARAAVVAGVRSIEHGTYLSDETLSMMQQRGTFLVPTVAVVRDLTEAGGDYDNPVLRIRGRHMYPRMQRMVRAAHRVGVSIVAATDTGYGPDSLLRISHDIAELTACGLSNQEAIAAATTAAARLLGVDDRTGSIAVGREADLILVEGDPLTDIASLEDVLVVISDGRLVLDRVSGASRKGRLGLDPRRR